MIYWLYILYSESLDKYYVGSTHDLEGRLRRHLTNHTGFTGAAKDWYMAYSEGYPSKIDAYRREMQIKNWKSKKLIRNLITSSSEHEAAS
jgi:putative endonuclease